MPTAKQIAACRANGQESRGPITPEGKAKSRCNALKHGIDANQQIMFAESAEDLAELAEYHEFHSSANAQERFLVDTLVYNLWRFRRLRVVEADLWRLRLGPQPRRRNGQRSRTIHSPLLRYTVMLNSFPRRRLFRIILPPKRVPLSEKRIYAGSRPRKALFEACGPITDPHRVRGIIPAAPLQPALPKFHPKDR
jgi:hypothetical protein